MVRDEINQLPDEVVPVDQLPKVKNWLNAWMFKPYEVGEVNVLPSETIPDQTMSMDEILNRFTTGLPWTGPGTMKPEYYGDEDADLPDPRFLDLSEREELRRAIVEELQSTQMAIAAEKKQQEEDRINAEQKKQDELVSAALAAFKKSQNKEV